MNIPVSDAEQAEILTAELSELPFESFVTEREVLKAYIPQSKLIDYKEDADEVLRLKQITGLAEAFKNEEFSKSWEPVYDEQTNEEI